jgi:glycerol-3-phosphate acyltransferase PlsY
MHRNNVYVTHETMENSHSTTMATFIVLLVGSYLLGSIPFGYFAGRLAGIDIRQAGSGNVGATNVVRVLGKAYGYPVFALDVLKGYGAGKDFDVDGSRTTSRSGVHPKYLESYAAMCSVLGHLYPPWLKFNGGKGVATSAGALLALAPVATLIGVAVW